MKRIKHTELPFYDLATQMSRAEEVVEIQHPLSVYDNAQNISAVDCLTLESFYHNVHNSILIFVPPVYVLPDNLELWNEAYASSIVPKTLRRTWQASLDPWFQEFQLCVAYWMAKTRISLHKCRWSAGFIHWMIKKWKFLERTRCITLNSQPIPACSRKVGPACPASNNTVASAIPCNHRIGVCAKLSHGSISWNPRSDILVTSKSLGGER